MKVEELTVGDLVYDGNSIAQVTGITCDGIIETTHNQSSNIEIIRPIPLSVEILEKNGLEKDNHGRLYGEYFDEDVNNDLEISVDDKTGEIWWSYNWDEYWIIRLRYVHELQNALRLCGIEKEIVL